MNCPASVEANQPLEIGFMVRQHGVTPLSGQTPVITARLDGSTESVIVEASEEGEVGHYVATLTLPQTGEWQWSIQAFTGTQPMPALTVVEATVAVAQNRTSTINLKHFAFARRRSWPACRSRRIVRIAKESTLGGSFCSGWFTRQRSWICFGGSPTQSRSEERGAGSACRIFLHLTS